MAKISQRKKITLTVDAELWAECKQRSKEYGLVWSQVAEQAFLAVLLQLREVEKIVKSNSLDSGSLDTSMVKSQLSDYIARTCVGLGNEFEEISQELKAQIPD